MIFDFGCFRNSRINNWKHHDYFKTCFCINWHLWVKHTVLAWKPILLLSSYQIYNLLIAIEFQSLDPFSRIMFLMIPYIYWAWHESFFEWWGFNSCYAFLMQLSWFCTWLTGSVLVKMWGPPSSTLLSCCVTSVPYLEQS